MGHVRLGPLPAMRKWTEVVGLLAGGAGAAQLATATAAAAERGLKAAANDPGVVEAVWVLARLPLAARSPDFAAALRGLGLAVPDQPGLMDVVAAAGAAIEHGTPNGKGRTDLGEMAQAAAVEALHSTVGGRLTTLFGAAPEDVRRAFAAPATPKHFGLLARDFFARFAGKCLNYFLGKAAPDQTGPGARFPTVAAANRFADALGVHCREAAVVVETFAGEWFSKKRYETAGEIERPHVRGFVGHAMTKLTGELRRREGRHGHSRPVLCGGASGRGLPAGPVALDIYGRGANVHFRLEEVRRAVWTDIPPAFRDLLDIAVYVYCADQAVTRANGGRVDGPEIGAGWRRDFHFRIPVRQPDVWTAGPVHDQLVSTLSFLSDDEYRFEFVPLRKDTSLTGFIDFAATPFAGRVEEVVLFSGGLDSLAGAIREAVTDRRRVLLVNHRSTEKLTPRHAQLVRGLVRHGGEFAPLHLPVRVNKRKALGREFTQRTRSFLFAALGATLARMSGLNRIRFYENGVVSLNLPPAAQAVGARASRTTHPRVLAGYAGLFTALTGQPFAVENPFIGQTKTDVVRAIVAAGCADLIGLSTSCAHTWDLTKGRSHCGVCSQCIDRRFAVLAAGAAAYDPAGQYGTDLLAGDWPAKDRAMLAAYLGLAERVERMDAATFFGQFGEAARALPFMGGSADAAAAQLFDLYRRHGREVNGVITRAIAERADDIRRRTMPPSCLLRMVYEDGEPTEPASEPTPEGNYFARRGPCWAVRFGDEDERVYTPDVGFEYLRILLESPGRHHTAAGLAAAVRRRRGRVAVGSGTSELATDGLPVAAGMGADDVLDAKAVEDLRVRLHEVEAQAELAEAARMSGSIEGYDLLEELESERRFITAELGRAKGRRGQVRKLGDESNRVRNRVCNAIRRAHGKVRKYDIQLAEHLVKPVLNLGHTISYVPRDDTSWAIID